MANPEHLKILKQGVETWNKWRDEFSVKLPELADVDFCEASLRNINLYRADLSYSDFTRARLGNADLTYSNLMRARFRNAHLRNADFTGANLSNADLSGADLINAKLYKANLTGADLSGADLREADLNSANLIGTDFSHGNLGEADFRNADLNGAILMSSNLRSAKLDNADLSTANLSRAILVGAVLLNANLSRADLRSTDLGEANLNLADLRMANLEYASLRFTSIRSADLSESSLGGAIFHNTYISDTKFNGARLYDTIFIRNYLSEAIGLEECIHTGPSILHSSTLQASGELPIEFLRGCGLSDWEIESTKLHQPNLSNEEIININYRIIDIRSTQAIQISPMFISYSHPDSEFVNKLGKQLTENGIRYWRDIHNATSGRLEKQVDRAMQLHPIVLLILSKNSTDSDWVELEATKARKLEKEMKRDVLCPIALDDSWKDCDWPERLRLQIEKYNILNFEDWEDNSKFDKMFSKLLSGLDLFYK